MSSTVIELGGSKCHFLELIQLAGLLDISARLRSKKQVVALFPIIIVFFDIFEVVADFYYHYSFRSTYSHYNQQLKLVIYNPKVLSSFLVVQKVVPRFYLFTFFYTEPFSLVLVVLAILNVSFDQESVGLQTGESKERMLNEV